MRIVCFGDSVTRGITCARGRFRIIKDNYPALLQRFLGEDDEVINKGVFNDNSDLLVKRLDKDVLQLHPDLVLINIGGNDCNFRWDQVAQLPDEEHIPIVPLDHYLSNIRVIVERIASAGAVPVILSLLPLDPVRYYRSLMKHYSHAIGHWIGWCGGIEHWHGMYNRALKDLVKKINVPCVDIRSAFKLKGNFSDLINEDGLHPTSKGYHALAEIIFSNMPHLKRAVQVHA
ncbi:GDSL-type esterase/lipase family protein [Sporolactobacillus sp. Y61]|uniref:GDSL-type esterase/lipase family protein n=1 Tax=Sporolactobacillus sp. Y61 TaxID=3160863 RepID=A0AAU8IDU3_9BACL|nr:GDSL-type esterase/lipase family protein [Sporolactobacillus sp. THM19-2]RYL93146.1 SGNH/GDSL hydrolase family protein [Sporolactobacillus sp. THM19-2]